MSTPQPQQLLTLTPEELEPYTAPTPFNSAGNVISVTTEWLRNYLDHHISVARNDLLEEVLDGVNALVTLLAVTDMGAEQEKMLAADYVTAYLVTVNNNEVQLLTKLLKEVE
jgi:hypothetical protein